MKHTHFSIKDLEKFALKVLRAADYPEDYAEATAWALLEADKRGIFTHGLGGGTGLEEAVKRASVTKTVNPNAKTKFEESKYPTFIIINANGAPGHYTSKLAVEKVKEIARNYGKATVYVINANHFGAAGIWSEEIAKDGDLIGEVTCTTPAVSRIMGDDINGKNYTKGAGKKVRLGTNPISISIPHTKGIITLDMSNTSGCTSTAILALKTGKKLNVLSYGADKNFKPTLDPNKIIKTLTDKQNRKIYKIIGSLFPLGAEHFGYKGDGMIRMIELDLSLAGGKVGCPPVENMTQTPHIKHKFEAHAIDFAKDIENPLERVNNIIKDIENYFGKKSRWPGDRARKAKEYCTNYGIPYSKGRIEVLKNAANWAGIKFDLKPTSIRELPKELFRK